MEFEIHTHSDDQVKELARALAINAANRGVGLLDYGKAESVSLAKQEDGTLIGGLFVIPREELTAEIMFVVLEQFEHQGVATRLVEQVVRELLEGKYQKVQASVAKDTASERVLQKNGFGPEYENGPYRMMAKRKDTV
mgnify:CR=1 FL=1